MSDDILSAMILNAPNFVGFLLLSTALYRRLVAQDTLIMTLIDKWESCEEDNNVIAVKTTGQEK